MRMELNRSLSLAVGASVPLLCAGLLHAQHSVDYQLTDEWQGGYNADIVLQVDPDGDTLSDWELSWLGSPEVEYSWNCTFTRDGNLTTLEHVWYNETIQPGDSVILGYTGIGSWPPSPEDVRINGVSCLLYTSPSPRDA